MSNMVQKRLENSIDYKKLLEIKKMFLNIIRIFQFAETFRKLLRIPEKNVHL